MTAARPQLLGAFAEGILLHEVYQQCKFALLANHELTIAILAPITTTADIEPHMDAIWYGMQNLLVACANISRLLWGDYQVETMTQRQPLRKRLGVTAKSPLRKRNLRNHFEHVDVEIVDQFGPEGAGGNFVGRNVGPQEMIKGARTPRFHHFDPQTGLLTFWKDSVSIPLLINELNRLLPIARTAARPWSQ